ncbi:hypothetical protein GDO81_025190 [Engystomops pustulosus]|uniref:Uncharacterized protein n=1 Tax=Engystomops pustulosus TaxID=76066 RepID=A0AAV6YSK4_ENGPU|nr:hypothetical protein GDO81_025190 [Engystomops pustulosus]
MSPSPTPRYKCAYLFTFGPTTLTLTMNFQPLVTLHHIEEYRGHHRRSRGAVHSLDSTVNTYSFGSFSHFTHSHTNQKKEKEKTKKTQKLTKIKPQTIGSVSLECGGSERTQSLGYNQKA